MIWLIASLSAISSLNEPVHLVAREELVVFFRRVTGHSQPLPLHQLDVGDQLLDRLEPSASSRQR